jgi:hypothetical protein
MLTFAERVLLALRAGGVAAIDVRIGTTTDKTTWRVTPVELQAAAQPIITAFDPSTVASQDAALTELATRDAARKDLLATCALMAKTVDPVAWAALTTPQRIARVRALAQDWRDFRIFVEKSL